MALQNAMEVCRACLSSELNLIPLNETFVRGYNLLTSLNIMLYDGISQYSCQRCVAVVSTFLQFREKCITSESTLQQKLLELHQDIKSEDKTTIPIENLTAADNVPKNVANVVEPRANKKNKHSKKTSYPIAQNPVLYGQETDSYPGQDENYLEDNLKSVKGEKLDIDERLYSPTMFDNCISEAFDYGDFDTLVKKEEIDIKPRKRGRPRKDPALKKAAIKPRKSTRKTTKLPEKTMKKTVKIVEDLLPLLCGICKEAFPSGDKEALSKHVDTHKNDSGCRLCNEVFNSWPLLQAHRIAHLPKEQYRCHVCHKYCFNTLMLEYHFRKLHCEGNAQLTCKQCLRKYDTPRKLKKHVRVVHAEKTLICDYCSKAFKNKQQMTLHVRVHQATKALVCDLCGFSCNYPTGLKNHIIWRHTPGKVYCKVCSRLYESQKKYELHKCLAVEKVCPICGLLTKCTKKYARHMRSHESVGRYQCDRCPAVYRTSDALKVHKDRHDGNRTQKCQYCERTFYTQSVLIKHRRTHTGEKPYVCKICYKGFTANHNLKVHMKVHGQYNLVVKRNQEPTVDVASLKVAPIV